MHHYINIAQQFATRGQVIEVREFGNGNISETYLVATDSNEENHFVLQRFNTLLFKQPKLIMQNMASASRAA